jgi:hypothetical protein
MSVTLTTDQASRLLLALRHGVTDAEREEFEALLTLPAPAYHTPAVPEITATTEQKAT